MTNGTRAFRACEDASGCRADRWRSKNKPRGQTLNRAGSRSGSARRGARPGQGILELRSTPRLRHARSFFAPGRAFSPESTPIAPPEPNAGQARAAKRPRGRLDEENFEPRTTWDPSQWPGHPFRAKGTGETPVPPFCEAFFDEENENRSFMMTRKLDSIRFMSGRSGR